MPRFADSHLGKLRQFVGHDLLVSPGAQVLVLDEQNRALLIRRADTSEWALPAGACEPGDSFRSTAAKELREETGLVVSEADLVPFASISDPGIHTIAYPNGDLVHAFALCFWVQAPSTRHLGGDGEATEFLWWPHQNLAAGKPSPMYSVTVEALRLYSRYVTSGDFQAA